MPRNSRRVAFNFQRRARKRDSRPNVYTGPAPTAAAAAAAPAPEDGQAAQPGSPLTRFAARRAGRVRARSAVYTEFLRQELIKFGAVTLLLVAVVIVASLLYE
jgi:hypothetical protein